MYTIVSTITLGWVRTVETEVRLGCDAMRGTQSGHMVPVMLKICKNWEVINHWAGNVDYEVS